MQYTKAKCNFLNAVVSKKPLQEILANICINNGILQTSNGMLTATTDMAELIDFRLLVNATKFLRAFKVLDNWPEISHKKMLVIKEGGFSVRLQPNEDFDSYPFKEIPDLDDQFECGDILKVFRTLRPFIGEASTAPQWANGILLQEKFAYATNTITIIRMELDEHVFFNAPVIVPVFAVDAILKVNESPARMSVDKHQAWFEFEDLGWLQTQVIKAQWPENIDDMLTGTDIELDPEILKHIKKLVPFCEDSDLQTLLLKTDSISTKEGTSTAEVLGDIKGDGAFHAKPLAEVLKVATKIDLSQARVPFEGDGIVGVTIGLKD